MKPFLELVQSLQTFHPKSIWSIPPDLNLGILATNLAFILSKENNISPNQMALQIKPDLENFLVKNDLPLETNLAGPYINLSLKKTFLAEYFNQEKLWNENLLGHKIQENFLLEFISPNVAKPLHIGHLLQANFGESLYRILKLKYRGVQTECFWGDWGVQSGILFWSWKNIGQKKVLVTINNVEEKFDLSQFEKDPIDTLVKVYIWGNQQKDLVENWDSLVRTEQLKLEQGDEENRLLWQKFFEVSLIKMEQILNKIDVRPHDYNFGESFYVDSGKNILKTVEKYNLWEKEGLGGFVEFENLEEKVSADLYSKIKSFGRCYLVETKHGYTSYALRDVGSRLHWRKDLGAKKMLTLVGSEQKHHLEQVFGLTTFLTQNPDFQKDFPEFKNNPIDWQDLIVFPHGMVNLPEGKMSTRKGNFVTAENILEQIETEAKKILLEKETDLDKQKLQNRVEKISLSALKWFNLQRDISQNVALDIASILNFAGNTGVYQLYTFARLKSILSKIEKKPNIKPNLTLLQADELAILNKLFVFPEIINQVAKTYKPHILCNYLFELASLTNSWYVGTSIQKENDLERQQTLLFWCEKILETLDFGLNLLGIETLENL